MKSSFPHNFDQLEAITHQYMAIINKTFPFHTVVRSLICEYSILHHLKAQNTFLLS